MKQIAQTSLHDNVPARVRRLMVGAVATLVFSCVYFSPLIDHNASISAVAQSRDGQSGDDRDGSDNRGGNRGGRGDQGKDHGGKNDRGEEPDRGERTSPEDKGRSVERAEPGNQDSRNTKNNQSDKDTPDGLAGPSKDSIENDVVKETDVKRQPAAQSPGSSNSNEDLIPRRPRFRGDSEPQSEPLSAREEREAIQNGWQ